MGGTRALTWTSGIRMCFDLPALPEGESELGPGIFAASWLCEFIGLAETPSGQNWVEPRFLGGWRSGKNQRG